MLAMERARRQASLKECIYELSSVLLDKDEVRKSALVLLEIYKGDFRHSYSDFFPLIVDISKNEGYVLDYLSTNLESIRAYVEADFEKGENEFKDMHDQLYKLCDHLNLEIGRWSYYAQNEQKIEDIESKSRSLTKSIEMAESNLKEASTQVSSVQTDLIAVLSIFAAIVITFSGGLTFLGSVMSSIGDAECYEMVVLTAIICGLIMFDTIFLMMYFVSKITRKDIYAACSTENCSCDGKKCKCRGITRIRKRLPYVFYFNIVGAAGILIDCGVWLLDIKGFLQ